MTDPRAALAALNAEKLRRRYLNDPVAWCEEVLGDHLWSRQKQVLEAIRDHRQVAVPSCHGAGKTYLASRAVLWWIAVHPPGSARVITTATTWKQVEAALWKEIRRGHVKGKLPGRTNRTSWVIPIVGSEDNSEEEVAIGHRPADNDPTAFQGMHARYVLVVLDEASGVPQPLWESSDSLISNANSHMLAIGNPTDPTGEFAEVCKPGSGWKVLPISAFDTPNFTGEYVPTEISEELVDSVWVDEKLRKWGEDNPMYKARVLGEFPEFAEDSLIPISWIVAAQQRELVKEYPCDLGVDVGGGGDKNIIAARWGQVVRIVKEDNQPDTMKTAGNIKRAVREYNAAHTRVDYIGIGRGAVDRLKEQSVAGIEGVQVSERADDPDVYHNLRAEGYWNLREMFQNEGIDIDASDEDLQAQLVGLRYETTSNGRIIIESKDSLKRRGKPSPDKADAVMLACLKRKTKKGKATWGRTSTSAVAATHVKPSTLQPQPLVPGVDRLRRR